MVQRIMHCAVPVLLIALLALASCGDLNQGAKPVTPLARMGKPGANAQPANPRTPIARQTPAPAEPQRPTEEALQAPAPIVEYWDTGNFLGGKPATLMLAIWRDGKVLRVLNNRAYIGYISNADVSRLMDRLAFAGVESAPFSTGVIWPDGGSQLVYININGTEISLRHDGSTTLDDLENYELPANATRQQMINFMQIWSRSVAALDDVWPLHLDLVAGMPAVPFPGVR
jgi:hypothetical protein